MYPPDEGADWPGQHVEWAESQWDVTVEENAVLVSYTGVLIWEALHDGMRVIVGGIGGVKTRPEARGLGHAAAGIARARQFFSDRGVLFALLVCDGGLVDYYSHLGWSLFHGETLTTQHKPFTFNRVMLAGVTGEAPTSGTIDLQGPPW